MIVLCVTNCPPRLRGDLSKWLSEINTGVYVGKLSAKVRGELWDRVCENIKSGQATMVYSTNNEQGYTFLTHNTTWTPVDYEGLILMQKPLGQNDGDEQNLFLRPGFSKASRDEKAGYCRRQSKSSSYVVVDVETTGLNYVEDRIVEIGLLKVFENTIKDEFRCFIQSDKCISAEFTELTGITEKMIEEQGIGEKDAFAKIQKFIGDEIIVGYNVQFDVNFIQKLAERVGERIIVKRTKDILSIARRKLDDLENYRLETVASYFSLEVSNLHRALSDCILTYGIYVKLNDL